MYANLLSFITFKVVHAAAQVHVMAQSDLKSTGCWYRIYFKLFDSSAAKRENSPILLSENDLNCSPYVSLETGNASVRVCVCVCVCVCERESLLAIPLLHARLLCI